jgi:hypothetical protein
MSQTLTPDVQTAFLNTLEAVITRSNSTEPICGG